MTLHTPQHEDLSLDAGVEVDLDEAWRKLAARQHPGSPGRAIGELTQNTLDSYSSSVPWPERRIELRTGEREIQVRDHGEGLGKSRIKLLMTLGGSDKRGDPKKIGHFGIGFYSIFNPALGAEEVVVRTRAGNGQHVVVRFVVIEPGRRPQVSADLVDGPLDCSTSVEVTFKTRQAVEDCVQHAQERLSTYRCTATINGKLVGSIWQEAQQHGWLRSKGACDGFVSRFGTAQVEILYRYERITSVPWRWFLKGGRGVHYDLRDYYAKDMPFLQNRDAVVNCNDLNVTISRDGFYLDSAFARAVTFLATMTLEELAVELQDPSLRPSARTQLILANQYVLRDFLSRYLRGERTEHRELLRTLAEAQVYRIDGRTGAYSVAQLSELKSGALPLYFSPERTNLRWLGGAFQHDFVVLPGACSMGGGAPRFYDDLFGKLFGDVVNLDTICDDRKRLADLVEREIISREALSPKARVLRSLKLSDRAHGLLEEVNALLASRAVRDALVENLALSVGRVRAEFFTVDDEAVHASTGLFRKDGKVLNDRRKKQRKLSVGLRLDHPFFEHLIESDEPNRAYYALTYVSQELARCQQQLVPDTPAFHFVKNSLAAHMRKGLTQNLLEASRAVKKLPGLG